MTDQEFLIWIHERLEHLHGENPQFYYMHRLRSVINSMDPSIKTPTYTSGFDSLKALKEHWAIT